MSSWLGDELSACGRARPDAVDPVHPSAGWVWLDAVLALLLLVVLALPLCLLVALAGGFTRQQCQGLKGIAFCRLLLKRPSGWRGAVVGAMGAVHWPVLLNILRADMAWVGPRVRSEGEVLPAAVLSVRPGLINPWFMWRRTAVDYGTEHEADVLYLQRRGFLHDLGLLLRGVWVAVLPQAAARPLAERVVLGDVAFDNLDMNQALARLSASLDGSHAVQVSFVNPACVNIAAGHRAYRRVLARADLVLPDGIGIKLGCALLGTPLKQNVNGTDLFPRLCDLLQARHGSVYLLGGEPGVADQVAAQITQLWPDIRVAGVQHGFFTPAEEGPVVAAVRAAGADVLLVARGVPGQELFVDRYLPQLGVKVAMGVGGLFDFVSGRIPRAPVWMRESGLEWVWRFLQEPSRMWRRYLIGNVTFLLRVALQRAGLRTSRVDQAPLALPVPADTGEPVRAVVFATTRSSGDMPLASDHPLALLPLGHQTLIEHLLARLSEAAVKHVDLVVSDRPQELRALLGDGSRWGLRLQWHLAKDPSHAYGVLDNVAFRQAQRLVIGHADRSLSLEMIKALASGDGWLMDAHAENIPGWSGWGSLQPARLTARCADLDRRALGLQGPALGLPLRLVQTPDGEALQSARQWLLAQPGGDGSLSADAVPASWIRKPWGAQSPLAVVDAAAVLIGPVLIGPGCIVASGAQVGPQVTLSKDVVVSSGTCIEHSLVLPGSYIGEGLNLAQCIVNGARVRHLSLGVESRLPTADALMLSLDQQSGDDSSWTGRAFAAMALTLAAPVLVAHVALRRLSGQGPAWIKREVVLGRPDGAHGPETIVLRCGPAAGGWLLRLLALVGGLMDVAAGRRAWFGMRPRSEGQWYAMRAEWQQMLSGRAIGLFHAPAWADDAKHLDEAAAAADVFASVMSPMRQVGYLWRALLGLKMQAGH